MVNDSKVVRMPDELSDEPCALIEPGGVGVDVALEWVGHAGALADCIKPVRRQGVVVQVGLHVGDAPRDPGGTQRRILIDVAA